jgi:hypothetical protein
MARLREHDIIDLDYIIDVAKGRRAPADDAYQVLWSVNPMTAADIETSDDAYGCGYAQGWDCEMSGRLLRPTPPVGLDIELIAAFCRGVIAGSQNVVMNRPDNEKGDSGGFYDPFSNLGV